MISNAYIPVQLRQAAEAWQAGAGMPEASRYPKQATIAVNVLRD